MSSLRRTFASWWGAAPVQRTLKVVVASFILGTASIPAHAQSVPIKIRVEFPAPYGVTVLSGCVYSGTSAQITLEGVLTDAAFDGFVKFPEVRLDRYPGYSCLPLVGVVPARTIPVHIPEALNNIYVIYQYESQGPQQDFFGFGSGWIQWLVDLRFCVEGTPAPGTPTANGCSWSRVRTSQVSVSVIYDFLSDGTQQGSSSIEIRSHFLGPPAPSSMVFREERDGEERGSWGVKSDLVVGVDHVGFNFAGLVYEAHPGYGTARYRSEDGTQVLDITDVHGVQAQHSVETFRHDSTTAVSNAAHFEEVSISDDLARRMRKEIETLPFRYYPFAVPKFATLSDYINAVRPSVQKGATGSFTCVGLVEWAAERAKHNGGQGFIPDQFEALLTLVDPSEPSGIYDQIPLLTPQFLLWAMKGGDLLSATKEWVIGLFDPVDFIITDPLGRRLGFTAATGPLNEIPRAFYSGNSRIEQVFIPNAIPGRYTVTLVGVGDQMFGALATSRSSESFAAMLAPGESRTRSFFVQPKLGSPGDVNADGVVSGPDIAALMLRVGQPATGSADAGDLDNDGLITTKDVTMLTEVAKLVATVPLLDRTRLDFGGVNIGGTLSHVTAAQTIRVSFVEGTPTWAAQPLVPWLSVAGGSGTGAGGFSVAVVSAPGLPLSGQAVGQVAVYSGTNQPRIVDVTLTISASAATTAPPFGAFDTPVAGTTVTGSIAVTGWALDDIEVERVEIWRDLAAGETTTPFNGPGHPGHGKVFIANALFVPGARPDVEAAYPMRPASYRAGWGYLLLTWGLWNQGNGAVTLHAFAFDREGKSTVLGTKAITAGNNTATRPFGGIDSPAYGETVTASFWNFGWALTPNANSADPRFCTINHPNVALSIDSGPLTPVTFGGSRTDIATVFPGFSNGAGAGGAYFVDVGSLANGIHSIGWFVTDDCGRSEGVGSRFFTVAK